MIVHALALGIRPDRMPLRWFLAWERHRGHLFEEWSDIVAAGVADAFSGSD